MTIPKLNEEERNVALSIGLWIDTDQDIPRLRWLKGNGALSGHGRGATEAEVRMWLLLLGREYVPWSLSQPGKVRAELMAVQ
jgi:hypothetical protein